MSNEENENDWKSWSIYKKAYGFFIVGVLWIGPGLVLSLLIKKEWASSIFMIVGFAIGHLVACIYSKRIFDEYAENHVDNVKKSVDNIVNSIQAANQNANKKAMMDFINDYFQDDLYINSAKLIDTPEGSILQVGNSDENKFVQVDIQELQEEPVEILERAKIQYMEELNNE